MEDGQPITKSRSGERRDEARTMGDGELKENPVRETGDTWSVLPKAGPASPSVRPTSSSPNTDETGSEASEISTPTQSASEFSERGSSKKSLFLICLRQFCCFSQPSLLGATKQYILLSSFYQVIDWTQQICSPFRLRPSQPISTSPSRFAPAPVVDR